MDPITITDARVLHALVAYARGEVDYVTAQHQSGVVADVWHPLCAASGLDTIEAVFDENDIAWLEAQRRSDVQGELADG